MNGFYQWVRNIVFYLLLMSLLYQILPTGAYKKYLKLVGGLILMIIALWPIAKITGIEADLSRLLNMEQLKINTMDFSAQAQWSESTQNEVVINQYSRGVEQQVMAAFESSSLYPVSANVSLETNMDSQDFGKVYSIDVQVVTDGKDLVESQTENVSIQEIQIDPISPEKGENVETSSPAITWEVKAEIDEMERRLAQLFYVDQANVTVTVVTKGGQ